MFAGVSVNGTVSANTLIGDIDWDYIQGVEAAEVIFAGVSVNGTVSANKIVLGSDALGSAATANIGTSAGDVVQLVGDGKLPALDGSNLTGISTIENNSVNSESIANGTIINEDVSNNASIAFSKLAISKDNITGLGIPATQNIESVALDNNNLLTIGIEGGESASVDLSSLSNTDDQEITTMNIDANHKLELVLEDGGTANVNLSAYLDDTNLSTDNVKAMVADNTFNLAGVSVNGTVSANRFVGDGSLITGISAGSLSDITTTEILNGTIDPEDIDNTKSFVFAGVSVNGTVTANTIIANNAISIGGSTAGEALSVTGTANISGNLVLGGSINLNDGGDLAELFDITDSETIEPGTVVSIDPNTIGKLKISHTSYDSKVVGVVSGANGIKPGLIMNQEDSIIEGTHPIALAGRVWVKCSLENGPIVAGDLLTTATKKGHAMKSTGTKHHAAVFGKAMSSCESNGYVLTFIGQQSASGAFSITNNKDAIYNGRVGIGTESPEASLDVKGTIKGTEICIGNECRTDWADSNDVEALKKENGMLKESLNTIIDRLEALEN